MHIGIVTISYNQARFLSEAIQSVQLTDRSQLQYVIVDAGSTDGSRELIDSHSGRFSRIIFEPDQGPAEGLNKGFAACDADVLGYLNSDDRLRPGALDFVKSYFERHPDTDVLFGNIAMIDEAGTMKFRTRTQDRFNLRAYAAHACNVFQQGTFFKRQAFQKAGGFNTANKTCWDGELVVDMALAGCRFAYVNQLLGEFRIYRGSITGSQRLEEQYWKDRDAIRRKIYKAGIRPYSPLQERLVRGLHKFNVKRHISYLVRR